MQHILCFGDSNTYGYKPDGTGRLLEGVRWTSLLQQKLGADFTVYEEGLCGRTTIFQDALREGRRGLDLIGTAVETHSPLDLVIIMLGTNDCKTCYGASAEVIAKGLERVIDKAREKAATPFDLLVISPIHLGADVEKYDREFDRRSVEVSKGLKRVYEQIAKRRGIAFLAASDVALPGEKDQEHMTREGHAALAEAVFEKVREILLEKEDSRLIGHVFCA